MHRIICGYCKGRHASSRDVFFCVSGPNAQRQPVVAQATRTVPTSEEWRLRTPRPMVENIKDGRYAVLPSTSEKLVFVRISRPPHGRKKGALVIQTQHSDFYKDVMTIWPSGKITLLDNKIDEPLLHIAADPITGLRRYATELGVCGRCGRELTDARSRYYGIGPECEKHFPDLIEIVNEEQGAFNPDIHK